MEKGEKNYYEILEISPQANQDEVYNGYVKAKNAYSQDSLALYSIMTKDQCLDMVKSIDEAYLIISDPEKRAEYDKAKGLKTFLAQKSNERKNPSWEEEEEFRQSHKPTSSSQIAKIVSQKVFLPTKKTLNLSKN